MISREEVAKNLREAGKELDNTFDKSDDGDEFLAAFIAIDLAIGQPKRSPFEFSPFFNRLADLIDPTCRIYWTDTSFNTPDTGYVADGYYSCSNCDGELGDILAEMWDSFQARGYKGEPPFEYCPYCGSRVVRGNHD